MNDYSVKLSDEQVQDIADIMGFGDINIHELKNDENLIQDFVLFSLSLEKY